MVWNSVAVSRVCDEQLYVDSVVHSMQGDSVLSMRLCPLRCHPPTPQMEMTSSCGYVVAVAVVVVVVVVVDAP
jgi:hypothetical protein